jgi:hypothetical protein
MILGMLGVGMPAIIGARAREGKEYLGTIIREGWPALTRNPSYVGGVCVFGLGCVALVAASWIWLRSRTLFAVIASVAGVALALLGGMIRDWHLFG